MMTRAFTGFQNVAVFSLVKQRYLKIFEACGYDLMFSTLPWSPQPGPAVLGLATYSSVLNGSKCSKTVHSSDGSVMFRRQNLKGQSNFNQ